MDGIYNNQWEIQGQKGFNGVILQINLSSETLIFADCSWNYHEQSYQKSRRMKPCQWLCKEINRSKRKMSPQ